MLDQPGNRKIHTEPRPLVGGIGMVIATTFSCMLLVPITGLRGYFLGLAVLLLIGFFDDFRELGHRQKFLAQIIATALLIYFSKVSLLSFGDLLGLGDILVGGGIVGTSIVTVFCVVGVINSLNLIDGLDGLAGGLAFIAFLFFAVHASFAHNQALMLLNLALAGATLGFLKFNWSPSVLFMGDAGSLCLGFSLSFSALALTQGDDALMSPVAALLILAVPITDTIIVMCRRILRRQSPFKPDNTHLHHIFLRYGLKKETVVKLILAISILLGSLSLLGPIYDLPDWLLFFIFLLYVFAYLVASFCITLFFRYNLRLQQDQQHLVGTDVFLRFVFGSFDIFKIFRKTRRFNVDLVVTCRTYESVQERNGKVLNISETGCMARINGLDVADAIVLLNIELSKEVDKIAFEVEAEHFWTSNHQGDDYHGFRFKMIHPDQAKTLSDYLQYLASKQRAYTLRSTI